MLTRGPVVMQDQVRNRVQSIMSYDIRHPDFRRRGFGRPLWLGLGAVLVYLWSLSDLI